MTPNGPEEVEADFDWMAHIASLHNLILILCYSTSQKVEKHSLAPERKHRWSFFHVLGLLTKQKNIANLRRKTWLLYFKKSIWNNHKYKDKSAR